MQNTFVCMLCQNTLLLHPGIFSPYQEINVIITHMDFIGRILRLFIKGEPLLSGHLSCHFEGN